MELMEYKDSPFELKASDIDDEGVFNGVASTFGGEADSHGDVIKSGAFKKTLAEGGRNKTGIELLKDHMSSKMPGVVLELKEKRNAGLLLRGQLALDTQLGAETRSLMKLKAKVGQSFGLSIGFNIIDFDLVKDDAGRRVGRLLKEIALWEVSIVTFPSNINARTTSIKAIEDIDTERKLEQFLRESGISINEAQYIVKLARSGLRELATDDGSKELIGLSVIYDSLKQLNVNLRGVKNG
jgi:hypothetical protein